MLSTSRRGTTPATSTGVRAGGAEAVGAAPGAISTRAAPLSGASRLPGMMPALEPSTAALTAFLAVADSGLNWGSVPTGVPSSSRAGPGQTPTLLPAGTAATEASSCLLAGFWGVSDAADTRPPPAATRATAERMPPITPARGRRPFRGDGPVAASVWVSFSLSPLDMLRFLTQGGFVPGQAGVGPAGRHGHGEEDGQPDHHGLRNPDQDRPRRFVTDAQLAALGRQGEGLRPSRRRCGQAAPV